MKDGDYVLFNDDVPYYGGEVGRLHAKSVAGLWKVRLIDGSWTGHHDCRTLSPLEVLAYAGKGKEIP